jgi:hypothetical protein
MVTHGIFPTVVKCPACNYDKLSCVLAGGTPRWQCRAEGFRKKVKSSYNVPGNWCLFLPASATSSTGNGGSHFLHSLRFKSSENLAMALGLKPKSSRPDIIVYMNSLDEKPLVLDVSLPHQSERKIPERVGSVPRGVAAVPPSRLGTGSRK